MSKIIKCIFFVLLAAVLPLSVHAQQVTLHLQDVTVRKAFRELEVKGNVSLVYEKNDVDLTRKVTVKVDNQPISTALDQILKGQELIYKIKDNHIIITRPVVQKSDKKRRINGVISDVNDELLIGVSVSIPGTNIGTVSNMEGKFELEIPEDAKKLQVSYIGFDTQEISLSPGKTTFNIVMGENVKMLSEVVVVGYGTQKKVNLTGSVATVNLEKESLSRPLVSASQALSGMTAGLQVMQSSGTPYNEGFSFNIRGVGTLNSSSPLVLVDGMASFLSAAPQTSTLQKKPFRHPILSYSFPETSWLIPYAIIKKIVIRPRISFAFCEASGSLRSIKPRSIAIPSRLVTNVTPFFSFICTLATLTESRLPLAAVRIYCSPARTA